MSGPLRKAGARTAAGGATAVPQVLEYSTRYVPAPKPAKPVEQKPEELADQGLAAGESVLDVMVALRDHEVCVVEEDGGAEPEREVAERQHSSAPSPSRSAGAGR